MKKITQLKLAYHLTEIIIRYLENGEDTPPHNQSAGDLTLAVEKTCLQHLKQCEETLEDPSSKVLDGLVRRLTIDLFFVLHETNSPLSDQSIQQLPDLRTRLKETLKERLL